MRGSALRTSPLLLSAANRRRLRALRLIAWLGALAVQFAPAVANPPRVSPVTQAPIAPRGGVMLAPFRLVDEPGPAIAVTVLRAIPDEVRLKLDDGRFIAGRIAWLRVHPPEDEAAQSWAHERLQAEIRSPSAAASDGRAGDVVNLRGAELVLLARLPSDARGGIWIDALDVALEPRWIDLPGLTPADDAAPTPHPEPPDGRAPPAAGEFAHPEPDNPLAHWRRVLLAWQSGDPRPEPTGSTLERLLAEHMADLWLAGLHRLETSRPAVASACWELLTAVAEDDGIPFVAWVVDPAALQALRTILLDETLSKEQRALSALGWADRQPPLLVWPESADDRSIRLAVVNRKLGWEVARFRWEREGDIPVAVELPGRSLVRVTVDRPPAPERPPGPLGDLSRDAPAGTTPTLTIASGRWSGRLEVPPRTIPVRPPGLAIGPLRPPLTLEEAERGTPTPVPNALATVVELRNLQGRWEFLIEAFRPADFSSGEADDSPRPLLADRVAVTLRASGGRAVELAVDATGRLFSGSADAATTLPGVSVRHQTFEDRWRARIILPANWLDQLRPAARRRPSPAGARSSAPPSDQDVVHLSVERHLPDGRRLSGPLVTAPWRTGAGTTIAVDLGQWDPLPPAR